MAQVSLTEIVSNIICIDTHQPTTYHQHKVIFNHKRACTTISRIFTLNREFKRPFGSKRRVIHLKPTPYGSINLVIRFYFTLFRYIPTLLLLRWKYKRREKSEEPRVIIYSDNLDETNGISVNSRIVVSRLRELGKKVTLVGSTYHTSPHGRVEKNGTVLAAQQFSVEQYGYKDSEMALPALGDLIKVFRRLPPDLLEIETPATGASLVTFAAMVVGIPVIQHYRTDMFAYVEKLNVSFFDKHFTRFWVRFLAKFTRPIIVPSEDFRIKVHKQLHVPEQDIVKIRRGVNLEDFSPEFQNKGFWEQFSTSTSATRFVYVGRVSKEKDLDFLETVWKEFRKDHTNIELLIVGSGPYLEEMKKQAQYFPEVLFAGKLLGEDLSKAYADADFFVFPSGTDTFGNVVVEALASGTPALVSNSGGPKDIVASGEYGRVVPYQDESCWIGALEEFHMIKQNNPDQMQQMRDAAVERSTYYDLDKSCEAFWSFYEKILAYRFL